MVPSTTQVRLAHGVSLDLGALAKGVNLLESQSGRFQEVIGKALPAL